MSSSSDFYTALEDLELPTTLAVVPPANPLGTTLAIQNNLTDPDNLIGVDIMDAMQVLYNTVSFPSTNPLDINNATYIMCWSVKNFTNFSDIVSEWASELTYGFNNCDDRNDTDTKTNHKFRLYLEYGMLLLKRYFDRTRESPLIDNLLFGCDKSIKETYFKFREEYFYQYYNNLRNTQYDILFTNKVTTTLGTIPCGWLDLQQVAITNIFEPLNNLQGTFDTYGDLLNNIETIVENCYNFLISEGNLAQFVLTTYPLAPFYGDNACNFDDKLKCIYNKFTDFPSYLPQRSRFPQVTGYTYPFINIHIAQYFADPNLDWFQLGQNNRSVISCLCSIIINLILHLMDKFTPYYRYSLAFATPPGIPPVANLFNINGAGGGITYIGFQYLQALLFYFIGDFSYTVQTNPAQFGGFRGYISIVFF